MIITYQGTNYHLDRRAITVDEWRELKRKYGMTPAKFQDAIGEADPDASTFLYWVMLRQAGQGGGVPLGDHLKPDLLALNAAIAAAPPEPGDAGYQEPEPDPTTSGPGTSPAPSPPSPATPATPAGPGQGGAAPTG